MDTTYDVVVLGGGPGGYVAAIRAAQYGMKTAIIERDAVGGTCLNSGCIPTKAMLHSCEILHEIREADRMGIEVEAPKVKLDKLYAYKDSMVKKLVGGVGSLLKGNGVDLYSGEGEFVDAHSISVRPVDGKSDANGEARTVSGKQLIIATGSRPSIPHIEGLSDAGYWTSTTLLEENRKLPKSMIIVGGGVIGTECATILNDLGVDVTVVEMMDQLLPQMDKDAAETLRKALKKDGVKIHTSVKLNSVSTDGKKKSCRLETEKGEESIDAEEIMVAVGRGPVTDIPGVEKLGLEAGRAGFEVNEKLQTKFPHIYAIGDVNGKWQLAHAASADGIAAVDHIAGKNNYTNPDIVPSCIYTRPEIASVGISAQQAKLRGYATAEGSFPIAANGKSMIMGENRGFVKIVSNEKNGEILGALIVGPRATDMIAELAAAMSGELTVEELSATIHPHPTVSEAVMEALHDIEGLSAHKPPKKKK